MRQKLLLICSLVLSGCLGPKVNTCLYDHNIVIKAVNAMPDPLTKEAVLKMLLEVKPQFCLPPDATDTSKKFYRTMKTGDHIYDAHDWGELFRWIEDHKK